MNINSLGDVDVLAGRPLLSLPTRFIWFSAPRVVTQARPENVYLTQHRVIEFEKYSKSVMRGMGFPIFDAGMMSQSRWDASYDGLHYLLQYSPDNWASHTSNMMAQAMMNVIFPTCSAVAADDPVFISPSPVPAAPTPVTAPGNASPQASDASTSTLPCGVPTDPFSVKAWVNGISPGSASFVSSARVKYDVSMTTAASCRHTTLILTPPADQLATLALKADIRPVLHFYTAASLNGSSCAAPGPDCIHKQRELIIRIGSDGRSLVAIFVPDPAAVHYFITLEVSITACCFSF